jgi:5'-nucleotidase
VVARSARNVVVQSEPFSNARGPVTNSALYPVYQPRADIAAHVAKYAAAAMAFSNRAIGKISGTGSKLVQGQLIADSQLAAGRSAGAQIAFMNTGGVRAPLNPAADGTVTFGDLYRVQPFGNQVMTVTLKGAQVLSIIEQSLSDDGDVRAIFLSQGMAVRYDSRRPKGSRLISATLDGRPIDPASNYRVSVSDFLLGGGDGFTQLKTGTNPVPGPLDIEAMEAWIKTVPTRALPEQPRAIDIAKP